MPPGRFGATLPVSYADAGGRTIYRNPDGYERYMGRWSALLAPLFLDFCGAAEARAYLDVGCGTGSLLRAIRARSREAVVVGLDPAPEFLAHLQDDIADGRSFVCRGEGQALPFADRRFDAVLGLLILQQMPDPLGLVREMARAARPGGTAATAIWNFKTGMPMFSIFWEAVEAVAPAAAERKANKSRPLAGDSEESLTALWQAAGLQRVAAATIAVTRDYAGLEDFWLPFLSNATPSSSVASRMDAQSQAALKAEIRRILFGDRPDGPFSLTAEAFAVRGQVPRNLETP